MWTDALAGAGPLLLLLDFDGTLVPIAERPQDIEVPAELPSLLHRLERAGHGVWIVSGRRADDVRARLGDDVRVVGVHGLDWPGEPAPARQQKLDEVRARAERLIAKDPALAGAIVEDKGLSIALHYRGVPPAARGRAQERLLALTNELLPSGADAALNVLPGHCIVEVRPREASKGRAVRRLVQAYPTLRPVYIGDDVTDEEAFAALGPDGVGVRVSQDQDVPTRASVIARDTSEVLRGLGRLA